MAKHRPINAHLRGTSRVDANGASARSGASPRLRCAVYTRKSSDEGLEQDFNSLHAQREACEAYIASQRHEGWVLLPEHYDDGGYSGGTIERPALKRLMADVEADRIDVIVVYKVDRLTRSLADFAKIIELFDNVAGSRNGPPTSFVSVTQSFNTTTSMGRLTLNVLLSFAQFEREVTGERIRDKIAASKKKGLWMGGAVPMGYRADGRTLKIEDSEATRVRMIFERYVQLGSVTMLAEELAATGERTPFVTSKTGRSHGGRAFSRGHLYQILSNPLYVGEIAHRDERHPGQHPAIIDRDLWAKVQAQLSDNAYARHAGTDTKNPSLFIGILYDADGNRLTASHATRRPALSLLPASRRDETCHRCTDQAASRRGGNAGHRPPQKTADFADRDRQHVRTIRYVTRRPVPIGRGGCRTCSRDPKPRWRDKALGAACHA